jgi:hypothetical protein
MKIYTIYLVKVNKNLQVQGSKVQGSEVQGSKVQDSRLRLKGFVAASRVQRFKIRHS